VKRVLLPAVLLFAASSAFAGKGRVVIVNSDPANVGLNEKTAASPVGGNSGTTLGQQRINVFEAAAARWSSVLETDVDIRIRASFSSLTCTEGSIILGSAGAVSWSANFTGAPRPNVWYPSALANKFAGRDLNPSQDDIAMQFNSDLDKPTCAGDRGWYYGLDGEEGVNDSLYAVALHEIGHGIGMAGRGVSYFQNFPSVYDLYMLDRIAGRTWDQLSEEQRLVSRTNTGNLVWNGPHATARAALVLERPPVLTVGAKNYDVGTASFGTPVKVASMSGRVAAALDAGNEEGPSTFDGCTPYENASEVAGRIALVDRGTCTFVAKALNAQAAGATGLVIADNRRNDACANTPPGMSGSNDEVRIPVVSLTQDDGAELRAGAGSGSASALLRLDPTRMAGTSTEGHVRLYAPCEFSGGSSLYHWDTTATPNLLMEPFINSDLTDTVDLTIYQLMDIGWTQPRSGRRILRR
jgi:hypothetical protein